MSKLEAEVLRDFIGLENARDLPVSEDEYSVARTRRFENANPEHMNVPFWRAMVRCGWIGYQAAKQFGLRGFISLETSAITVRGGVILRFIAGILKPVKSNAFPLEASHPAGFTSIVRDWKASASGFQVGKFLPRTVMVRARFPIRKPVTYSICQQ